MPINSKRQRHFKIQTSCVIFQHPLKLIYNREARGLLFILQYAEVGNMLIKCQDLIGKIESFTFDNSEQLFISTFDIKDMYTNLEYNIIIKHVEWLLDFVNSKSTEEKLYAFLNLGNLVYVGVDLLTLTKAPIFNLLI